MIGVCFPANEKIGPGDRFIVGELAEVRKTPKIAVVTKTDLVAPERIGEQLLDDRRARQRDWASTGPRSSRSRRSAATRSSCWRTCWSALLPEGPPLYPEGDLTDEPEQVLVAELIREAALEGVRDELPHSIAVVVEEMLPREDRPADKPLLDIHANLYVERDSPEGHRHRPQGRPAEGRRAPGPARQIEALLGTPVYLDLHVKVAKDWQRDPHQLRKLGF